MIEENLCDELRKYEDIGVSLWLKGRPSSSSAVSRALYLREEAAYMRDYVFKDGKLSEIRFDRIAPPAPAKSKKRRDP